MPRSIHSQQSYQRWLSHAILNPICIMNAFFLRRAEKGIWKDKISFQDPKEKRKNIIQAFDLEWCESGDKNGLRSFRYKVVSLQVVSLHNKVVSLQSRFAASRFAA